MCELIWNDPLTFSLIFKFSEIHLKFYPYDILQ